MVYRVYCLIKILSKSHASSMYLNVWCPVELLSNLEGQQYENNIFTSSADCLEPNSKEWKGTEAVHSSKFKAHVGLRGDLIWGIKQPITTP